MRPGDSVSYNGEQKIIVDISEEGDAVLRDPDDDKGLELESCQVEQLTLW